MGWQQRLLSGVGAIAMLVTALLTPNGATATSNCAGEDRSLGFCSSGGLTDDSATVGAYTGGRPADTGAGSNEADEDSDNSEAPGVDICRQRWSANFPLDQCTSEAAEEVPIPTLTDVREFFPDSAEVTSEPDGWAVKGKPANFIVPSRTTLASGTVLGLPTEVRFTPTAVRWDYGDGTTASTTTGGATWAALDQPRFTRTATSHTYDTRAERTVTANVEYTVSYRFAGGDWKPIDGTLSIPTPPTPMRIVVGSTVLVQGPCTTHNTNTC